MHSGTHNKRRATRTVYRIYWQTLYKMLLHK